MSFEVLITEYGKHAAITLKDIEGNTSAEVYSFGALLNAFTAPLGEISLNVIDGFASIADAVEHLTPFFKSAKLSPYVCRVNHAAYQYNGRQQLLGKYVSNGHALHGLIYDAAFTIAGHGTDETSAYVQLETTYDNPIEGFPFPYKCLVEYRLFAQNCLSVTTTVTNLYTGSIPVTDGWHPYFTLGDSIDNCDVQFNSSQMLEFDEGLIPTGKLIPYDTFKMFRQFGPTFFDNCFLLDGNDQPACVIRHPEKGVQVEFHADKSYPYLQFYTPDHRRSIAVENLSAAPDAFNNGMGLVTIEPGKNVVFNVKYIIRSTASNQ